MSKFNSYCNSIVFASACAAAYIAFSSQVVCICTTHSDALRLAFLAFATAPDMQLVAPSWHGDTSPNAAAPVPLGCVLTAQGLYSILEQSGVCDAKDMLLPMWLVEDIVAYVLDGKLLRVLFVPKKAILLPPEFTELSFNVILYHIDHASCDLFRVPPSFQVKMIGIIHEQLFPKHKHTRGSDHVLTTVSMDDVHEHGSEADGEGMGYREYCIALCACACHVYIDPFLSIAQVFLLFCLLFYVSKKLK